MWHFSIAQRKCLKKLRMYNIILVSLSFYLLYDKTSVNCRVELWKRLKKWFIHSKRSKKQFPFWTKLLYVCYVHNKCMKKMKNVRHYFRFSEYFILIPQNQRQLKNWPLKTLERESHTSKESEEVISLLN